MTSLGPPAGSPRVSLLMPNRDNAPILGHVLEQLARHTTYPDVELIVVDDGSTDGSREILRDWRHRLPFADVQVLEREPRGVVAALNEGLAAASGELVVQLDGDASVESSGWLEPMVRLFATDPRVGVVTGRIVFDWGQLHTCGTDLLGPDGFHDRGHPIAEPIGERTYHQRIARRDESDCPECAEPAEVDAGIGCCMMYRREAALAAGGYDPGFAPVWFDDLDLAIALRREGLKAFYLPEVRVIHHVGRRIAQLSPARQLGRRVRHGVGAMLPGRVRRAITYPLQLDHPPAEQWDRIQHHYAYWRQKWGWDMLNPELAAIGERWGTTEIAWRMDPERRRAGEEILAAYRSA